MILSSQTFRYILFINSIDCRLRSSKLAFSYRGCSFSSHNYPKLCYHFLSFSNSLDQWLNDLLYELIRSKEKSSKRIAGPLKKQQQLAASSSKRSDFRCKSSRSFGIISIEGLNLSKPPNAESLTFVLSD